jgi:hypothetical protein
MNMISIYTHQSYLSDHQQQQHPSNHLLLFNNKQNRAVDVAMAMDINNPVIKALLSTKLPRQAPLHSSKVSAQILLQITVQLKILSIARDCCCVLTKISGKPPKSLLAVEMVKQY